MPVTFLLHKNDLGSTKTRNFHEAMKKDGGFFFFFFLSKVSHVFVGERCEKHSPRVSLQNLYKKEIIMTLNLCP